MLRYRLGRDHEEWPVLDGWEVEYHGRWGCRAAIYDVQVSISASHQILTDVTDRYRSVSF